MRIALCIAQPVQCRPLWASLRRPIIILVYQRRPHIILAWTVCRARRRLAPPPYPMEKIPWEDKQVSLVTTGIWYFYQYLLSGDAAFQLKSRPVLEVTPHQQRMKISRVCSLIWPLSVNNPPSLSVRSGQKAVWNIISVQHGAPSILLDHNGVGGVCEELFLIFLQFCIEGCAVAMIWIYFPLWSVVKLYFGKIATVPGTSMGHQFFPVCVILFQICIFVKLFR